MTGDSNNKTNFSHKLLITDTQVSRLYKAFANNLLANTIFSKTQLSKMVQTGGFIIRNFNDYLNFANSIARFAGAFEGLKEFNYCVNSVTVFLLFVEVYLCLHFFI